MKHGISHQSGKMHTCGGMEARQLLKTKQAGIRKEPQEGHTVFPHEKNMGKLEIKWKQMGSLHKIGGK